MPIRCFENGEVGLLQTLGADQVGLDGVAPELRGDKARHTHLRAVKADGLVVRRMMQVQHVADDMLDAGEAGRGVRHAGDDAAQCEKPGELARGAGFTLGDAG